MKKRRYLWLAAGLAIAFAMAGCSNDAPKTPAASSQQQTDLQETEVRETEPQEAVAVRLEDDYYEAINGEDLATREIAGDAQSWSQFYVVDQEAYQVLNELLQKAVSNRSQYKKGDLEQKIADFYLTAMDKEGRRKAGLGQLKSYTDAISNASSLPEFLQTMAGMQKDLGEYSIFGMAPTVDMKDSNRYVGEISTPDLGLGKETLEDETQAEQIQEYKGYISRALTLSGLMEQAEAEAAAGEILDLQRDLAASALPLSEQMNPETVYNLMNVEQLQELFSNVDVKAYRKASGADHFSEFIVSDMELAKKVNEYLTEEHLELLKKYTLFVLISDYDSFLTPELTDNRTDFYNRLGGVREKKADEKRCSEMTQRLLSFEFGRLYVGQCFSDEDKQAVTDMIHQVIGAYKTRIDQLDWMGEDTKAAAKKKLDTMVVKVGYPDQWPDTNDKVSIVSSEEGGCLIDNALALNRASTEKILRDSREPVDKTVWSMTPQTVNAYYNPLYNEIVFPAVILQPPFYQKDGDLATNMGGIGTVIAHEISHAFDTSGAMYDEKGNLNQWWTDEDLKKFKELTDDVVAYYDKQEGFDGRYVNGRQTLTENIADLGALSCVTSIVGNDPETLRKLFMQYAVIWEEKYTDETMINLLNTDTHSPAKVRVNAVLRTLDAFYLAYPDIKEGDGMYLAPEDRVRVW